MFRSWVIALLVGLVASLSAYAETGGRPRQCFSSAETVEMVAKQGLSSPALALRTAAAHSRAEALRLVLCSLNDQFVYEITLLRRDGRIIRSYVKAADGVLIEDMTRR